MYNICLGRLLFEFKLVFLTRQVNLSASYFPQNVFSNHNILF